MSNNTAGVQALLGGYKYWEKLPAPFTIVGTGSFRPNAGPYARDFRVSDGENTFWIVLSAEPPPPVVVTVSVPGYTYWEKIQAVVTTERTYSQYDGTAESIGTLFCAGYYSFKVPQFTVGAVVGLSKFPTQIGYACIEHGLHFSNGKVRVIEGGEFVTAEASYDDQTYFSISRDEDGEVTYYSGSETTALGTLFYTSVVSNLGITRLHAALLQGGDRVVGMDGPHQGTCAYVDEPATGGLSLQIAVFGSDASDYNIGNLALWASCGGQEARIPVPDRGSVYALTATRGYDPAESNVGSVKAYAFCWGYDFGATYQVGIVQQFTSAYGFEGETLDPLRAYGAIELPDLRVLFDEGYAACQTDCGGIAEEFTAYDGPCLLQLSIACSGREKPESTDTALLVCYMQLAGREGPVEACSATLTLSSACTGSELDVVDNAVLYCTTAFAGREYPLAPPDGSATLSLTCYFSGSEYDVHEHDGYAALTSTFRVFGSEWADYGTVSCTPACAGYDSWRQVALAPSLVFVMNGNTLGVVEYSVPAVSVALVENVLYFVTANAVRAEASNGFEKPSWSFSTGKMLLTEAAFGSVAKLSLTGKAESEMRLTVTAREYGQETEAFYSLPCESTMVSRGQHVLLARDVNADAWSFKFNGESAAEIRSVNVLLGANQHVW